MPALVFFNACESGRLRATVNPLRQLDRSVGFAEAFLRGGVANFIGTWWPVSDAAASAFATALYRDLAKGGTIGNALNDARAAVRALHAQGHRRITLWPDNELARDAAQHAKELGCDSRIEAPEAQAGVPGREAD